MKKQEVDAVHSAIIHITGLVSEFQAENDSQKNAEEWFLSSMTDLLNM